MGVLAQDCCILNEGGGAWAFEPLARQLASRLGIEIAGTPRRFNYLLHLDDLEPAKTGRLFIPFESVVLASDKRLLAAAFNQHEVPAPETVLMETFAEVLRWVQQRSDRQWCLKYPTSCGARGHRMVRGDEVEPANWPGPFVVQEFIPLEPPEVYRIFGANSDLFGWVVRRFPAAVKPSPWVAHAQGARYVNVGEAPAEAREVARRALIAAGLFESFGCVDLLQRPNGDWLALEVGTDGVFNHVDRELGDAGLEAELGQRVADAFWAAAGLPDDESQTTNPGPQFRQKILFVCARNRIRSYTAEKMFTGSPFYDVRSRGVSKEARIKISERDIRWADVIFVMEKNHGNRLREEFGSALEGKEVICLFVKDIYEPGEAALIAELEEKLAPYLKVRGNATE